MVLPLLPIIAGMSGIAGGFGLGSLLAGGKKEQEISQPSYQHTYVPIEAWQYSPTQIFAPSTQYQISSPGAIQTSKKVIETVSKPTQAISPTVAPSLIPSITGDSKSDILPIAVIAVIGVVAYGYMKGKKK